MAKYNNLKGRAMSMYFERFGKAATTSSRWVSENSYHKEPDVRVGSYQCFVDSYMSQGLYLSYIVGFALFAAVLMWEVIFGNRFSVYSWLFIVAWLLPQALVVRGRYYKSNKKSASEQVRIAILLANALMHIILSVAHSRSGDGAPYFYIAVLGQVTFCYAFTNLSFKNAVASGVVITLSYFFALFLVSELKFEAWSETAFLFILINGIGMASSWRVEKNYQLQYRLSQRLQADADHDALTGLLNRRSLNGRLTDLLNHARQKNLTVGVVQVDLDKFKLLNDRLGHAAGDQLLQNVGGQLAAFCNQSLDVVARVGGDEFVLAWLAPSPAELEARGREVVGAIAIAGGDENFGVTGSVGLLSLSADGLKVDVRKLLHEADMAAMSAKQSGGDQLAAFNWNGRSLTGGLHLTAA